MSAGSARYSRRALPGAGQWLPFLIAVLSAAVLSALLALLLGWPMVRLRADYLAITLIGAAEVLRRIATEERWLVNGSRGLGGIPRPFAGVVDPDTYRYLFLLLAAILVVVAYVLADRGIRSPWGACSAQFAKTKRRPRQPGRTSSPSSCRDSSWERRSWARGRVLRLPAGCDIAGYLHPLLRDIHHLGDADRRRQRNMVGAIVGVYVIWGLWSTTLQLQGYELPAFVAGRIPTSGTPWSD